MRYSAARRPVAELPHCDGHDVAAILTGRQQIHDLPYSCRFGVNDGRMGGLTLTLIKKGLPNSFYLGR
jgi:hypothetical protein